MFWFLDWLPSALSQVQLRNECETIPFEGVCVSNSQMFHEISFLERQINLAQRSVSILQHETANVQSSNPSTLLSFIGKIKASLGDVQTILRDRQISEEQERATRVDTTRIIRDQAILIQDQVAELAMAKVFPSFINLYNNFRTNLIANSAIKFGKAELAQSREEIVALINNNERSKGELNAVRHALKSAESTTETSIQRINELTRENEMMLKQILGSKLSAVDELNKRNEEEPR